jgi:hypothetical protein
MGFSSLACAVSHCFHTEASWVCIGCRVRRKCTRSQASVG